MTLSYPNPQGGASLFVSLRLAAHTVVLIGSGSIAATRAFSALESGARVIILAEGGAELACDELKYRAEQGQLIILDQPLEAYLSSEDAASNQVRFVCITDTLIGPAGTHRRTRESAQGLYRLCQSRGILVNTSDMPELCDFTYPATQRIGESLQVAVTTNGLGCRLAGRIKRHVVSSLPKEAGEAVVKVGMLRRLAKDQQRLAPASRDEEAAVDDEDDAVDESGGPSTPNRPVPSRTSSADETHLEASRRRMKWVAQISEYWAFSQLAALSPQEMLVVLSGDESHLSSSPETRSQYPSQHSLDIFPPKKTGRILLLGSGPGHPSLLTLATYNTLTQHADLVLSDKLVPSQVLDLIPKRVTVRIARKFPGNAEGAQIEMMEAAVEGAQRGLTVVRLKQGDPTIYGRSSEEIIYFRQHGFEPLLIPGVSSSLAAPALAGIPLTQRGVSDSVAICTGVGRGGKGVELPGYVRARALVVLMGVARLPAVIDTLTRACVEPEKRNGPAYPPYLPIAIIERASMPDQRVIKSTLEHIEDALASNGDQRPPGLFVIGWSVLALGLGEESMAILDDACEEKDRQRVAKWLGSAENEVQRRWVVEEGLDSGWEYL